MVFRRLAKDSLIYGGADFITKSVSFTLFPILASSLASNDFGVLELILTSTGLISIFINCGLNNATGRFYWDANPKERASIITTGFVAQIIFGLFFVVLGVFVIPIFMPYVHGRNYPITFVSIFSALLVMVFSQSGQYVLDTLRLHFSPWKFLTLSLISRVVSIGLGVFVVCSFGLGIDGFLGSQALVLFLVLPIGMLLIKKDLSSAAFNWACFKQLVSYGHNFIYAGLAFWLFGFMDRWMLAAMASVEEVGIYSVAARFASIVMFVSSAFGLAWSPIAIKMRYDFPDKYRIIYGQVLLVLFYVMMLIGGTVSIFAGEIISLVMPAEYITSGISLAILSIGVIIQATHQVTAIGISIECKTHLIARSAWLSVVVNFTLNWALIPYFGAAGAACGTFASYLVLTLFYFYYTQKFHPLVVQWWRLASLLFICCLVCAVSITLFSEKIDINIIFMKVVLTLLCYIFGLIVLPVAIFKVSSIFNLKAIID